MKHLLSFAHSAKRFENDNVEFGFWGFLCKNLHMWKHCSIPKFKWDQAYFRNLQAIGFHVHRTASLVKKFVPRTNDGALAKRLKRNFVSLGFVSLKGNGLRFPQPQDSKNHVICFIPLSLTTENILIRTSLSQFTPKICWFLFPQLTKYFMTQNILILPQAVYTTNM